MILLNWLDDIVMIVILLLAFEQVRRLTFFAQPLAAVIFALLAVSAFGKIAHSLAGGIPPWWAIAEHIAFALLLLRAHGAEPSHWSYVYGLALRRIPRVVGRSIPQTPRRQRPHPGD